MLGLKNQFNGPDTKYFCYTIFVIQKLLHMSKKAFYVKLESSFPLSQKRESRAKKITEQLTLHALRAFFILIPNKKCPRWNTLPRVGRNTCVWPCSAPWCCLWCLQWPSSTPSSSSTFLPWQSWSPIWKGPRCAPLCPRKGISVGLRPVKDGRLVKNGV